MSLKLLTLKQSYRLLILMGLIRFLLACGVVLGHSGGVRGFSPLGGDLAVQCFYIISGFYMALILNEKYTGKKSAYTFYTNRALKIYPLYWAVLILRVIWAIIIFKFHYPGTLDHYAENWPISFGAMLFFIITNVLIIGLDCYFFLGIKSDGTLFFTKNAMGLPSKVYDMAFNFIAWTISLELVFYIFAPFIARRKTIYIVAILLISASIRLLLISNNLTYAPWTYMFFPAQVMFFMAGILSHRLYVYYRQCPFKKVYEVLAFTFIMCLALFYYDLFEESYFKQIFLFTSLTVCIPLVFNLTKSLNFDNRIGNLSYSIYISQILFLKILPAKSIPKIIDLGFTTLLSTIILSIILNYLITRPIDRYRQARVASLNRL